MPAKNSLCNVADSMPRWRSQLLCDHRKELWGIPHQVTRLFVNSTYDAPRRQIAVRPILRPFHALRIWSPGSKYIYIDAFSSESVTRETLLRYTLNSIPVNNLISGNLWKKSTPRVQLQSLTALGI